MSSCPAALPRKIQGLIRAHALISSGAHVLVAVSGGADSVALLSVLRAWGRERPLRLTAAHFNHGLRGRAAQADARFVRALCADWNIPCRVGRADGAGRGRGAGVSVEMAARKARYAFLERTARAVGANLLATGHTSDDQAETVLMRLMRGAGMHGWGGMRLQRPRAPGLTHIRPLLNTARCEVMEYLQQEGLAWREDESNRDLRFTRNRVRHETLPLLERSLNPNVRETLCRMADLCREDSAWLDQLAQKILEQCQTVGSAAPGGRLRVAPLLRQPLAARRRVLLLWLRGQGVAAHVDTALIGRIETLLQGEKGRGTVPVAGGGVIHRRYGELLFLEKEPGSLRSGGLAPQPAAGRIEIPGVTLHSELGLRVTACWAPGVCMDRGRGPGCLPARASLGAEAVAGRSIALRCWRAGDRMRPWGMQGAKKLQDVFTDAKVPLERRARTPIFECDGEIVWVPGYRIARGWGVSDPAAAALQLRVESVRGV